ncbi:MAG TPA: hypothetical protein VGR47_17540 [Terracidiphilus sp.]|nr:hypothetical protein [Terracidiphilus sp.]
MNLIVKCRVSRHGQPISPPFVLECTRARGEERKLPDDAGAIATRRSPRAGAHMYFWQLMQCVWYQTTHHPNSIDALLEVKAFELRYNSLDRAVERLRQLVREGR